MEAKTKVKLQPLEPYLHLFPKAKLTTTTLKKNATVFDTVNTVTQAVEQFSWQVRDFVDQELGGLSVYDACERLWYWLKYHIDYVRDPPGFETVKTPQRLVSDGYGDCDDYCFFINCVMRELGVRGVLNRITKYTSNYYQHIYPLVPIGKGKYIVVDCVVDAFNYEEPYTTKKDYEMELQILNGIEPRTPPRASIDAQDLLGDETVDGLLQNIGNGIKNVTQNVVHAVQNTAQNVAQSVQNTAQNVSQAVSNAAQTVVNTVKDPKELLHVVNQVNPAVALLRLGFLASMKLNLAAIASNIKWAYLSKADAEARGIDPNKYDQLVQVFHKAEEIFYGAGGSKENLREAILTGEGNKNHEVSGLGAVYNRNQPLSYILGERMYSQNAGPGLNGTGLGEVVSAAAIAAAASAIGALAALIGKIGDIFKKKTDPAATQQVIDVPVVSPPKTMAPMAESIQVDPGIDVSSLDFSSLNLNSLIPASSTASTSTSSSSLSPADQSSNMPSVSYSNSTPDYLPQGKGTDQEEGFWSKNKKWILPVGGVAVVGLTSFVIYKVRKGKKRKTQNAGVSGVPRKKGKHGKKKGKRKYPQIAAIPLR